MIRKTLIIVLTLAAFSTAAACAYSLATSESVYIYREYTSARSSYMLSVDRYEVRASHWLFFRTPRSSRKTEMAWLGFGLLSEVGTTPFGFGFLIHRVSGPVWAPFLLLGAYPTVAFIRGPLRLWRRRNTGHCLRCGYDLTGNVSGVCPECGTGVGRAGSGGSAAGLDDKPL